MSYLYYDIHSYKKVTSRFAEITMIPQTMTKLTDENDIKNINKLIDALEDNDDIQDVWHNWEITE